MTTHFRIEIKALSKAQGQSAEAANRYDDRASHSDKSDLIARGSVNMPGWANDVSTFWAAADLNERANGLVARRAILSFPNQLPASQRESYVREWLSQNCPTMPASWAVHDDPAADPSNPHVHLLVSERLDDGIERPPELFFKRHNAIDPAKGGCKKADIGSNRKDWLTQARKSWADILNRHLPADHQVSHLSNVDQGMPAPTVPKFGAKVLAAEKKGIRTKLVSRVFEDSVGGNKIRCLSFVDSAGKTVTYRSSLDKGLTVEILGKLSRSKVIDLVRACREKGWREVTLFGTDEFKQLASLELARAGIKVKGEHDEQNRRNDPKQGAGSGDRDGKDGRGPSTRKPSPTSPADEPDRRSDEGRERPELKTNRDVADALGTEVTGGRETSSLDSLDDSRRVDILVISSAYDSARKPVATGLPPSKGGHDMSKDLTYNAVRKQLAAMSDAQEFEIGILNQATGRMMLSKATAGQILQQVARLKRENARGNNIYIRPDRHYAHPYVLLDDLNRDQLAELESAGFAGALTIETSSNNHQVLIKLPQPLVAADRKQVERALQKRFNSDPGSADGQHLFRLAGYTNRKPKHEKDGRFPYVLVKSVNQNPVLSESAREFLTIAPTLLDVPDDAPEQVVEKAATARPEWRGKGGELAGVVSKSHKHLQIKYGLDYDPSIADFQIAKTLLKQGWNSDSVREGIREGSPDLLIRKAGHVEDYLVRTLSKVTGRPVAKPAAEARPEPNKPSNHPRPRI